MGSRITRTWPGGRLAGKSTSSLPCSLIRPLTSIRSTISAYLLSSTNRLYRFSNNLTDERAQGSKHAQDSAAVAAKMRRDAAAGIGCFRQAFHDANPGAHFDLNRRDMMLPPDVACNGRLANAACIARWVHHQPVQARFGVGDEPLLLEGQE